MRNVFGLNYDFGQIWDLIQLDDEKPTDSQNDEVTKHRMFKK